MISEENKQKLAKLRSIYTSPDSLEYIAELERDLIQATEDVALANHPGFQKIVSAALKRITDIDFILSNSENQSSDERAKLFGRKEELRFFLGRFSLSNEQKNVALIETTINEKIRHGDSAV